MLKTHGILLSIGLLVGTLLNLSFHTTHSSLQETSHELKAAEDLSSHYRGKLQSFKHELQLFYSLVMFGNEEEKLIPSFLQLRCKFKEAEFLLCYVDNNFTRRINGANLQWVEGTVTSHSQIMEPHGLQVMEDLLYNPEDGSRTALKEEIKGLQRILNDMTAKEVGVTAEKAKDLNIVIWDALKNEIFRIESMGITGFDVPDSKNSIPETIAVLSSLDTVIGTYAPVFDHYQQAEQLAKGHELFAGAIKFCRKQTNFDSFDRFNFLKKHLHPISEWINTSLQLLHYEFPDVVRPINPKAKHLFATDFMNPDYFLQGTSIDRALLGKKLFFDSIFSLDGSRSCASCHDPEKGYADGLVANTILGTEQLLGRNTPSLWNAGWQSHLFYDSRARSLEVQVETVIANHQEMGGDIDVIAIQLSKNKAYKELFDKHYGGKITAKTVVHALANYVISLTSNDSPFDRYMRGEEGAQLDKASIKGFNLFMGKAKCATCHFAPNFNGLVPPHYYETESEILGVANDPEFPHLVDEDIGKSGFTGFKLHQYAFKTSTVRNSDLSPPYMHNGAYKSLKDVLEFYNNGGGVGQGMDLPSQTLPGDSLQLTEKEVGHIISFIKSLNDESKR